MNHSTHQALALPSRLVRLAKISSVDFAQQAFELYCRGEPFVIDNPGGPSEDLTCELADQTPQPGGGWVSLPAVQRQGDDIAQIIFSSGTEGRPKAILVSYRALAKVVERLNKAMSVDSSIREYVGVPVTYSFGLGRLRAVAAAGGKAYLPAGAFDISELLGLLEQGAINAISAVPTLWRIVLENAAKFAAHGDKIRWIEIGSQYMSGEEKAQLKALFPKAIIVQHYGLTEASRSTLLTISAAPAEALESVGDLNADVEIALAEDGRIKIRGEHLASGKWVGETLQPLVDDDGWLVTSDLGEIKQGWLYYRGRADDIINCAGVKINPDELQQRLAAAMPEAKEFAVCAVPDALRGQGVFVATTCAEDVAQLRRLAQQSLQAFGLQAGDAVHVAEVAAIPKTATGKVRRKALADLHQPARAIESQSDNPVVALFQEYFGALVEPADTFKTLGGDSLRYVQVSTKLEDIIGHPPKDWEGLPLAQLAALKKPTAPKIARVEITVFLRALAILAVVVIHAGVESLYGATVLLFMLVGYNFARFQTDALISGPRWKKIGQFIGVTLIPYYAFAALFIATEKHIDIPLLLLYENYLGNDLTLVFPFWFVQQLTQSLLLLGLVFSLPVSRRWLAESMQKCSLVACALVVAATLLFQWLVQPQGALKGWPIASHLALFVVGWTFYHAQTLAWRLMVAVMGISVALVAFGWHSKTAWLTLGCVGLTFFSTVYATRWIRKIIDTIAASTLFLFVTNGIVIYVLMNIVGPNPWLLAAAALAVGIGSWYAYEHSGLKSKFII
ncbi:AMP-binding protein [Halioxenophilus aromaticivorans]|uniref:AMP-binding protein n=1 Tax=Halioxenophilus aromaticivorans TaxID=1306992 RepID=A0AAV3U9B0_9ALTE